MVRRVPFSSLFYTTNSGQQGTPPPSPPAAAAPPAAWMWPSCKHPRTQSSLRAPCAAARTIASLFVDSGESSFANSSARTTTNHVECASDSQSTESAASAAAAAADDMAVAIVRGLRSDDRLLFEPHAPSSSILERKPPASPLRPRPRAAAAKAPASFGNGVAVAFDSADPYRDFRASMEDMVAAHGAGAGDWAWLERMLAWYFGANGRDTHPAIVTAFVDLVVSTAAASGCACSSCSRVSSFTLAGSEPGESSSAAGGVHFSFGLR
ncbi:hypothetical protein BS78_09G159900 [Paspalum vaginatum]|nr:hypothetical protein BS78_09G159900 [Paspalum vaginatum]